VEPEHALGIKTGRRVKIHIQFDLEYLGLMLCLARV